MRARHKFKAKAVNDDGHHFSSQREWKFYKELQLRQRAGDVIFFMRQIPFHLPGGVKYVADYQIFNADGSVTFIDVKGMDTPLSKSKRKIVEAMYPIKIELA